MVVFSTFPSHCIFWTWAGGTAEYKGATVAVSDPSPPEYSGVLRGCVDRLLLFGVDDDIRNVYAANTVTCRQTERKLLRLFPLSADSPSVSLL